MDTYTNESILKLKHKGLYPIWITIIVEDSTRNPVIELSTRSIVTLPYTEWQMMLKIYYREQSGKTIPFKLKSLVFTSAPTSW